tara:strand:+ start:6273 stop:6695 length:423 start_codon:yes stop_codon:yes gene_type:complete
MDTYQYSTVLTSYLFLTNGIHLTIKRDFLYAMAFYGLFVSSVIFHSTGEGSDFKASIGVFDKIMVYLVVFIGGHRLFSRWKNTPLHWFVVFTFLLTIYLYWYGYATQTLTWDEDKPTAYLSHVFMHSAGCLGHHSISLLL